MLMQAVAGFITAVAAADGESCSPRTLPSAQEAAHPLAAAPPSGPQKVPKDPNVCDLPVLCDHPFMHLTSIWLKVTLAVFPVLLTDALKSSMTLSCASFRELGAHHLN